MADISKINPNGDIYDIKDTTARAGLNLKADKVLNATANNFATLDANGNLTDSGKKASDFMASDGVVANPQGTATGTLTKLGIGSDIYDIQGGSGGEYRLLTGTLLANAWSNNTQTVTIQGISSTTNGVIGLLDSATSVQIESAKSSEINVTTIGTNSVSFVCKNVPTVDIPFGILIGGGGDGASALADLTDVNISNPTDGQILQYDATSQKWVNHVNIPEYISLTVDIYSAANDTVTFTDATGQKTATTDIDGHERATIIFIDGDSITFTSSVAKNPSDLLAAYSKTVNVTSSTTEIYVMPDDVLYWYGYKNSNLEDVNTTNGWSGSASTIFDTPAYNTNAIALATSSQNHLNSVGSKTAIAGGKTINAIASCSGSGGLWSLNTNKNINSYSQTVTLSGNTDAKYNAVIPSGGGFLIFAANGGNVAVKALWLTT